MTAAGKLIALEGGEGAGKSTQAKRLAEAIGAELTREPGGTSLGEELRRLLLEPASGPIAERTELLLMLASRAQHLAERIEPALLAGRHVVVDRFSGSTIAYQGYGRGLPIDEVTAACLLAANGRTPDLNVLIDVPVSLGASRRRAASEGADRIEKEERAFHEAVRQGFLAQAAAEPERWCVIDGGAPLGAVTAAVHQAVGERLGLAIQAGR